MHFYRGTLTLDDGTEVELEKIGKGAFSTAYITTSGRHRKVYVITQQEDAGDYSKEIISHINSYTRSPYIPKIEYVGCLNDGSCVYRMPKYEAPLRKSGHPKAWAQYRTLKKCWEEAEENVRKVYRKRYGFWKAGYHLRFAGHEVMNEVIDCAKRAKVSRGLIRALELLKSESSNYGAGYSFEFSPRNLATSGKDQLILLDVIFDRESIAKRRDRADRKARGY